MYRMYSMGDATGPKRNDERMRSAVARLKHDNASRYGLPKRTRYNSLIDGTTLNERKVALGYNLEGDIDTSNMIIFTGQCLVKKEEDTDCFITLEDAIECARLREVAEKSQLPVICMYPDVEYTRFLEGMDWLEPSDAKLVEKSTRQYMAFRGNFVNDIKHVITSDLEDELNRRFSRVEYQIGRIARGYGGRPNPSIQLKRVVLRYGLDTLAIPEILGYYGKNIVVFAEPDEVCSVKAAEIIRVNGYSARSIGLIGQIPLPGLTYPGGKIRMFSEQRRNRVHLNESDGQIREAFELNPLSVLLFLYMSPLTTQEDLNKIGKSMEPLDGLDLVMGQVNEFRGYLGGVE